MPYKNFLSVTFDLDAQFHSDGWFTVPEEVCNILGLDHEEDIHLRIETTSGEVVFDDVKTLKSGTEIYGNDIRQCVQAGQRIRVTASRPESSRV